MVRVIISKYIEVKGVTWYWTDFKLTKLAYQRLLFLDYYYFFKICMQKVIVDKIIWFKFIFLFINNFAMSNLWEYFQ